MPATFWQDWAEFLVVLAGAAVLELILSVILVYTARFLGARNPAAFGQLGKLVKPLLIVSGVGLVQIAVLMAWPLPGSRSITLHVLLILLVLSLAWLASAAVSGAVAQIQARHPIEDDQDQEARRLQTQLSIVRGLGTAAIWLIAVGIAFFTIPGAEAVGTSLLASAGLASVVAGIAAQSFLGNLFAGIQLAFSGTVRTHDLISAAGTQGRVEDITLTTIVVRAYDGRRMILPSSYFTTTPFENWTRGDGRLTGTVLLDVDWRVSIREFEDFLHKALAEEESWDEKNASVTVSDATGGSLQLAVTVGALSPAALAQLRSHVRRICVEWLAAKQPQALPVARYLDEG